MRGDQGTKPMFHCVVTSGIISIKGPVFQTPKTQESTAIEWYTSTRVTREESR